jgi:paraquat-inducible protein B
MEGGIAFATPDNELMGAIGTKNMEFVLHDKPEKGWLAWTPVIELEL